MATRSHQNGYPALRGVMRAVAAAGLIFASLPALAGNIGFTGVVPGASVVNKQVESIRELRYANVIEQQTDFSCGAAALATLLKHAYGMDVDEAFVLSGMMMVADTEVVRQRGFSLLDIKRYVEALGMRGRGYKVGMAGVGHIKIPTIVLLDIKGYRHFVVLKTIARGNAYIADPALGNKVIPLDVFAQNWNGIAFAVIGTGFDRNTVLRIPHDPPTVRRFGLAAPLTDSELLEYGFTHADLF